MSTYKHLEHLHHKHGVMLHMSVFVFSLLLGIGIGVAAFTLNAVKMNFQKQEMQSYEEQVMNRIVQKIEAAPLVLPYPSEDQEPTGKKVN